MFCKFFWQLLRRTYPWLSLAIVLWRMICRTGNDRLLAQLKFWRLYSRIDFASLLAAAIDLTQPEFWV